MTKKDAIVVHGSTEIGRSSSVLNIYNWLMADFIVDELVPHRFRNKGMSCVIRFNYFRIGLCCTGDIRETIAMPLSRISEHDCEILICTSKTKANPDVAALSLKGYNLCFIKFGDSPEVNFMRLKDALIERISERL